MGMMKKRVMKAPHYLRDLLSLFSSLQRNLIVSPPLLQSQRPSLLLHAISVASSSCLHARLLVVLRLIWWGSSCCCCCGGGAAAVGGGGGGGVIMAVLLLMIVVVGC
ncbi:hypothetical protein PIB30_025896 [Stylosanthes scabra]|uniref:Uncharacterized protein n=1 Tax=Stylosanthes scabra TaxID=79078 RepID=A0ABU6YAC7_9FABA|nr:hypothetical protein [Stylosanthes scabra]